MPAVSQDPAHPGSGRDRLGIVRKMARSTGLGEYLRARRALVRPEDAGLPARGGRRVPGLRREELAALAGISSDYYLRLEQGRDQHPSPQVIEAVARALRLDEDATAYLHGLAQPEVAPHSPSTSCCSAVGARSIPAWGQGRVALQTWDPADESLAGQPERASADSEVRPGPRPRPYARTAPPQNRASRAGSTIPHPPCRLRTVSDLCRQWTCGLTDCPVLRARLGASQPSVKAAARLPGRDAAAVTGGVRRRLGASPRSPRPGPAHPRRPSSPVRRPGRW